MSQVELKECDPCDGALLMLGGQVTRSCSLRLKSNSLSPALNAQTEIFSLEKHWAQGVGSLLGAST